LAKQAGDADLAAEFQPWRDWWTPAIAAYPPPFPENMLDRVKDHFLTFVLMDLSTCPVPPAEIPPHIVALLPDDLLAHLRQQFPTDEELTAIGDYGWAEARGGYTLPHYVELSERRAALRATDIT
jgi:hypothetical protein